MHKALNNTWDVAGGLEVVIFQFFFFVFVFYVGLKSSSTTPPIMLSHKIEDNNKIALALEFHVSKREISTSGILLAILKLPLVGTQLLC